MERLEGFGKRKAEIVYNAIQSKIKDVQLSKLQHASNLYKGLGSKKLALLEQFGYEDKPNIEDILKIQGFSNISAISYLEAFDKFKIFIKDLPLTINKKEIVKYSDSLEGKSFCFTGVRRQDLETIIEENGGKVASGVSRNLTYLICKDKNSGSSKLVKAEKLGVILFDIEELEKFLEKV
jgi:NAD-dependent DNA ligase